MPAGTTTIGRPSSAATVPTIAWEPSPPAMPSTSTPLAATSRTVCSQSIPGLEHDRSDPAPRALVDEVEPLGLAAPRLEVHEQHAPGGRRHRRAGRLAPLECTDRGAQRVARPAPPRRQSPTIRTSSETRSMPSAPTRLRSARRAPPPPRRQRWHPPSRPVLVSANQPAATSTTSSTISATTRSGSAATRTSVPRPRPPPAGWPRSPPTVAGLLAGPRPVLTLVQPQRAGRLAEADHPGGANGSSRHGSS